MIVMTLRTLRALILLHRFDHLRIDCLIATLKLMRLSSIRSAVDFFRQLFLDVEMLQRQLNIAVRMIEFVVGFFQIFQNRRRRQSNDDVLQEILVVDRFGLTGRIATLNAVRSCVHFIATVGFRIIYPFI